MNEVEDFRNLYPLDITEVTSHRIANQIYEGLVRLSQKDLTVVPGLAESWTKNDAENERVQGRIVDDIKAVLPFGQSGYMIQNAL